MYQFEGSILSMDPSDREPLARRPGHWEHGYTAGDDFAVVFLEDDRVALRSVDTDDYWRAVGGGSDAVNADAASVGASDTFELISGPVGSGQPIKTMTALH